MTVDRIIESLGLTLTCKYNTKVVQDPKNPRLNWMCTLSRGKRSFDAEFHQGYALIKGLPKTKDIYLQKEMIRLICETGYMHEILEPWQRPVRSNKRVTEPLLKEVLYYLCLDAQVLNYATFEEWANEYGYEEDNRKAEALYRECITQSLKLSNLIGSTTIESLNDAYAEENY